MAIFKAKPANPFTQIPNTTLQDTSLSFEAKGLLVLILSLPEDWEIHKSWLQKQTPKCGQDKLKRLLKELTDTGYMVKKAKQSEDGKLAGWDWFVYPEKQPEPAKIGGSTVGVKNRPTVSPIDGKTSTTNKHINKKTSDSSKPAEAVFDFDLVLVWIVNQLTNVQQLTDLDKIFIEGALHDYHDSAERPRRAQAFSWIEQALKNRLATQQRSAKASAARDKLNTSVKNQLETQAAVIDQHTKNMEPKTGLTLEQKLDDRTWAEE